jgi:hypothetical protein
MREAFSHRVLAMQAACAAELAAAIVDRPRARFNLCAADHNRLNM